MKAVELFTGAGGLAMGISKAGFNHEVVIEWDRAACNTIRKNQANGVEPVVHWPLVEMDVRQYDFSQITSGIDLVAGGPPCQPFSLGGKHGGHQDERNMFPETVRVVRELKPRTFLFENVKGLLRQSFARYFAYILLQLTYPEITRKQDESWEDHYSRLQSYKALGAHNGLYYNVLFRLLAAPDYGVGQKRDRVFIVGFRCDQQLGWCFPNPTHTQDSLLWDKWVTGEYWERHGIVKKDRPQPTLTQQKRLNALRNSLFRPTGLAWVTTRDAIADLPDPERDAEGAKKIPNHWFVAGARSYPGHTGSVPDEPAKTLKAGDHGVPGGENTLVLLDGGVRYFTVRESARLQSFPDDYVFQESWTETMRQLGNAVPVQLAYVLADSIRQRLEVLDAAKLGPSIVAVPAISLAHE